MGSVLLRGEKSHIEYLGDLILMLSMVIGPTKFIGDLKLDPRSCSGHQGVQQEQLIYGERQYRAENHTTGVINDEKFNGGLKLDPQSCSGPSRGATYASSLRWKAVQG